MDGSVSALSQPVTPVRPVLPLEVPREAGPPVLEHDVVGVAGGEGGGREEGLEGEEGGQGMGGGEGGVRGGLF